MRQIIQDIRKGKTLLEEVPAPEVKPGTVLIRTTRSLVSQGTERMLVEFGKAGIIEKARQQPDKVKQVLDKVKTDGIIPTIETVFNKLNRPLPMGYCNVGKITAVGKGVKGFSVGDRVASNGNHAEFVCVPENLAVRIPSNVSDEEATFTVVGAIALQGIRLCNPAFGETIVVAGLGLIGLITAELLKVNGCRVIGYDVDQSKVDIANKKGILAFNPEKGTEQVKFVEENTEGRGADGVIITASTKSDEIIHDAARMSRKRGRIVLTGVAGLNIRRSDFYEKELTFQVSCSYGPGRYDDNYELKGRDYPIGYVRWTEKRNFEAVLDAISQGRLDVKPLISEIVPLESYRDMYDNLGKREVIASILKYPEDAPADKVIDIEKREFEKSKGVFGIIGAGNFTTSTIIPCMKAANAEIKYIASAGGLTAATLAKKSGIPKVASGYKEMLEDGDIDAVVIATRHNLHAKITIEALKAGKHVFVEKPLCINEDELIHIIEEQQKGDRMVVAGFNRRFSPLSKKMKEILGDGAKNIVITINAGAIPSNSWVHDPETGGGRIIGEACHFIDLCTFLSGSKVISVCMNALGTKPQETTDNASILLKYENGTNGVINYFANGSRSYPKERIEAYSQERTLVIDNWRELRGFGTKGFSRIKTRLDKGHKKQFSLLVDSVKNGGEPLIPFDEIVNTTRTSFAAIRSLKEGKWIPVI